MENSIFDRTVNTLVIFLGVILAYITFTGNWWGYTHVLVIFWIFFRDLVTRFIGNIYLFWVIFTFLYLTKVLICKSFVRIRKQNWPAPAFLGSPDVCLWVIFFIRSFYSFWLRGLYLSLFYYLISWLIFQTFRHRLSEIEANCLSLSLPLSFDALG